VKHHVRVTAGNDLGRLRVAGHEMLEHALRQLGPIDASWNRSATSSVEAACFSHRVPAISAGMIELTAVNRG
jgi:hypothetical protein